MKNILIIQNYNANKGDSSVVYTMLNSLRSRADRNISYSVTSYDPAKAFDEYGIPSAEFALNLREIKLRKGLERIKAFIREGLWVVYGFLWLFLKRFLRIHLPIPSFKKNTIKLYEAADVVVLPGGHFFTNFNGIGMIFSHFFAMAIAFAMKKRTMIYAQTIGPFFGKFKIPALLMTKFVVKNVDVITLREKGGLRYCKGARNVHITAETVFALETDKSLAKSIKEFNSIRKQSPILVGVTIHHLYYKHYFSKEKYIDIMSDIMMQIIQDFDAYIVIIPMEDAVHNGGDRPLAKEMIKRTGLVKKIHLIHEELSSPVTASLIANTDIFIGTKTHSIVYGLKGSVPTISISYQDKSNQFMKMFGVYENAIDMEKLNVDDFMKIFKRVFNSRELYKAKQAKELKKIRHRAEINNEILLNLLKD